MDSETFQKWEEIIDDVSKTKIPVEFIKKLVLKLRGRKQHTINIQRMIDKGFDSEEIEQTVVEKLEQYDDDMINIEFVLDVEGIANLVQPETDILLKKL
jgi:hypothetical protein